MSRFPVEPDLREKGLVLGINADGQIVGDFEEAGGKRHGFARTPGGAFTAIDVPSATDTSTDGIKAGGQIVGVLHRRGG